MAPLASSTTASRRRERHCTSQRDVEELFDRQQAPGGGGDAAETWDDFMYKGTLQIYFIESLALRLRLNLFQSEYVASYRML